MRAGLSKVFNAGSYVTYSVLDAVRHMQIKIQVGDEYTKSSVSTTRKCKNQKINNN